jgi:putative oxidoreductase
MFNQLTKFADAPARAFMAIIFHADFGDQIQQIMFLKNAAMAGGFLLLAKVGAPGYGVDQFLAARKGA